MEFGPLTRRWLSPLLFGLAGLCFLLPFATVSCDGAETTFTGAHLVTRTVPAGGELPDGVDVADEVERQASSKAIGALVAIVLGLALGAAGLRRGPGWCAAVGLAFLLALGVLAFDPFAGVTIHAGYLLALLLVASTGVIHAVRAVRRLRETLARLPSGTDGPRKTDPYWAPRIAASRRRQQAAGPSEPAA